MVIAKFNNTFLDNLIQFVSNSKFKEKESLNYLIIDRKLLIIIPIIFRKEPLITKSFKTIEEWQNYIDNEFKNFILKNNISKITINLNDKPDLIIMQNGEKIGVELTSVFPFLKDKKRGDIFKHHDDKQTKIKNNVVKKLMALNLEEKMPWIKIFENNNRVVFPKEFTNLKDKKLIEEAIGQVEKVEQIVPMTFIPNYFKCLCDKQEHHIETLKGFKSVIELIGKNSKNDLNINNYELNLINTIKEKNDKLEKYYKQKVENNVLLILVEEMSHFLVLTVSARDGLSDIYSYHGVKDECCIKDYFNRVYWNVEKEKNNFDQTIIIYKNTNAIKHIFILK